MKTVLIVDDEKLFLASLTEGLASHGGEFQVVTAANGRQAVDIINSRPVDLVVTDLKMPVMDGFQFLAHLMNENFNFPVIVMTAFGTPEIENQIRDFQAFGYLEKPIDFQKLTEKISEGLSQTEGGHLKGISLFSFLQLLQMEQKTCLLKTRAKGREGTLAFYKGELFDAVYDNRTGEEAALEIVCWEDAEIEIANIFKKVKRRIEKPLTNILMDAAKAKDESSLLSTLEEDILLSENRQNLPDADSEAPATDSPRASQLNRGTETPNSSVAEADDLTKNKNKNKEDINLSMANNVNQSLEELMQIEGAKAVALVDSKSGMALGTAGGGMNLEVAAAGNSEVIKAKHKTMSNLGIKDKIEDVLITLGEQYHLIRPLNNHANLFFYIALNRATANLAMARFKLSEIEGRVEV